MIEIPLRIKILSGVVIAVSVVAGTLLYGDIKYEAGRKFERETHALALAKENKVERVKEQTVNTNKDTAYDQYIEQRDQALRDADAARTELDRLRNTLATYKRRASESQPAQCRTDEAAPLAEVVGACAQRYQELGRDAQLDAEQVIGLQNYIKAVAPICIGTDIH